MYFLTRLKIILKLQKALFYTAVRGNDEWQKICLTEQKACEKVGVFSSSGLSHMAFST